MGAIEFASRVPRHKRHALERLLFFNGCQERVACDIVDVIDRYGPPEIYDDGEGLRVRVANPTITGHTRVPRYVRHQLGTIVRHSCTWPHPTESAATGRHGPPEHVYAVAFDATAIFGPEATHTLVVDIWERDLEEAA